MCASEPRASAPLQSTLPAATEVVFLEHKCDFVGLFLQILTLKHGIQNHSQLGLHPFRLASFPA